VTLVHAFDIHWAWVVVAFHEAHKAYAVWLSGPRPKEFMMRFYHGQHSFYCGIDLHSKTLHACVVDDLGEKLLHRNYQCLHSKQLFHVLGRFDTKDIIIVCESIFNWYCLADVCAQRGYPFLLGHTLYLNAILGAKTKSDSIDSEKLARIIRGGNFPVWHVYPLGGCAARDLMRRRTHFVRRRAEAFTQLLLVHYPIVSCAGCIA